MGTGLALVAGTQRCVTDAHLVALAHLRDTHSHDIEHDALLNVIDREGYLRVTYPAPLYIGDVVSDIIKIAHS